MELRRWNASCAGARDKLPPDLRILLERLSGELKELYGERYRGMVLCGFYARGEADEGSDVDLLRLVEGEVDQIRELMRTQQIKWPLAFEGGYTVSPLTLSVHTYETSKEPFIWNGRTEGIPACEGG